MAAKKVHVFVTDTMNSHFFVTRKIVMKFGENVNQCALLNFNIRILIIFPYKGGDFASKQPFLDCFNGSP